MFAHAGTHSDAPSHFFESAAGIDAVPLTKYFGPCRVISRPGDGPITADEVAGWPPAAGMRLLVRTRDASAFFSALNQIVLSTGADVETVAPADESVRAVYDYLIGEASGGGTT